NPKLRELHRGYIRQCLDNFAENSNVIQLTSAEYSGPLAFTEFWLDTIIEWEKEKQGGGSMEQGAGSMEQGEVSSGSMLHAPGSVLIALSAPKDVQDAILADSERAPHVDVIDIRYWAYTADGGLYAPHGGQNLAPRQHLRQTREKPGGAAAIVKAVREYRDRFPEKAVIYSAEENCPSTRDGWAVLIAGGSLPEVKLPQELAQLVPAMRLIDGIVAGANRWCLASDDGNYLIYSTSDGEPLRLDLPSRDGSYVVRWIDRDGRAVAQETVRTEGAMELPVRTGILWVAAGKP
ncbi:MAG TPA: DUF6298 domain-containing protein, partial [Lacipirellulaceae bacterium]|nr:DUF6298 domain-containing protein [Lacipirellulaceae bacterium]